MNQFQKTYSSDHCIKKSLLIIFFTTNPFLDAAIFKHCFCKTSTNILISYLVTVVQGKYMWCSKVNYYYFEIKDERIFRIWFIRLYF